MVGAAPSRAHGSAKGGVTLADSQAEIRFRTSSRCEVPEASRVVESRHLEAGEVAVACAEEVVANGTSVLHRCGLIAFALN